MKNLIVAAICFALFGCNDPDVQMQTTQNTQEQNNPIAPSAAGRIRIERIGIFEDSIAYGSRRGIYLIHDDKTDSEYIGISGIGISEVGSHMDGKISAHDER